MSTETSDNIFQDRKKDRQGFLPKLLRALEEADPSVLSWSDTEDSIVLLDADRWEVGLAGLARLVGPTGHWPWQSGAWTPSGPAWQVLHGSVGQALPHHQLDVVCAPAEYLWYVRRGEGGGRAAGVASWAMTPRVAGWFLNTGFNKVCRGTSSSSMEFRHKDFCRSNPAAATSIRRRVCVASLADTVPKADHRAVVAERDALAIQLQEARAAAAERDALTIQLQEARAAAGRDAARHRSQVAALRRTAQTLRAERDDLARSVSALQSSVVESRKRARSSVDAPADPVPFWATGLSVKVEDVMRVDVVGQEGAPLMGWVEWCNVPPTCEVDPKLELVLSGGGRDRGALGPWPCLE
jgi:hypothetical protein